MTDDRSFLRRVARAYVTAERDIIPDCCFVFPNKRSATFFLRALQELMPTPALMPATTTISQLVGDISGLTEATRLDRLFILYNQYLRRAGSPVDFDRFLYWGEMLLADFDDVDRYLVDPKALFVNVKRFREIRSNYLTDEQLAIIQRYWGGVEDYTPEVERFWQHTAAADGKDGTAKGFLRLWEAMLPLYNGYHESLAENGMTSPGGAYRAAVEALASGAFSPRYERYVFVGFNVLSAAELRIFEELDKLGVADFYWDLPAPALRGDGDGPCANKAMRFVNRNARAFPSRHDIADDETYAATPLPQITIVSVPSRVGQAKVAGRQVHEWVQQGVTDPANAIDTAVILPDEGLFISAINSIPSEVTTLNVTMGYPLKRTPVATFLKAVTTMHLRARRGASLSEVTYFAEDVMAVLRHSVASAIDEESVRALAELLARERRFRVDSPWLLGNFPSLAPIFAPVANPDNLLSVGRHIRRLLELMRTALDRPTGRLERKIHSHFIEAYSVALQRLLDSAHHHKVKVGQVTALRLIERALAGEMVQLKGEPLRGLQMMGVLETRALDFDNVVIMSMNESIFPGKSVTRSFIPDALRLAYRMSTLEHQESIFAYYFYRLISRARRVTLLYDGRTVGTSHSEMSRYLVQLLYPLRGSLRVQHRSALFESAVHTPPPVVIHKSPRVMEKLRRYLTPGSGKALSASSINVYIDCPLQFYLRFVEGYDIDDAATDFMDSSTYGKIVHRVAEQVYLTAQASHGEYPVLVTPSDLRRWIDPADDTLARLTRCAINEFYLRVPQESTTPLRGEPRLMLDLTVEMLRRMLEIELQHAPFTLIDAERRVTSSIEVAPGLKVNITQVIDRIDDACGAIRVVDYKTGDDSPRITFMDQAFSRNGKHAKAIMQTLFYCRTLLATHPQYASMPVMPVIYPLRSIFKKGIPPIVIAKKEVTDYRELDSDYGPLFDSLVAEIFNPQVPFTQGDDVGGTKCGFCKFKLICGVQEEKK